MNVYLITVFVAVSLAALAQQRKKTMVESASGVSYCYTIYYKWLFYLSFLVLAVTLFLTKSGTDIPVYANYYETWTLKDLRDLHFEPGAKILFIFLHWIIPDPYVGLGVIKVITLALFYRCLYLQRHKINLGLAILGYSVLLFIYSFQLLRMMLAVNITFLAVTYEMQGRSKKCIFLMLIALTFHYSSIAALFAYIIYRMLGKGVSKSKIIVVALLFVVAYVFAEKLIDSATSQFAVFAKYTAYSQNKGKQIGALQVILLLPVICILVGQYRYQNKNKEYLLAVIWGICVCFTGFLGYLYPVSSRSAYFFYYFFLFFAPSCVLRRERIYICISTHKKIPFSLMCLFIYLILQVIAMYVLNDSFESNGLEEYILLWQ